MLEGPQGQHRYMDFSALLHRPGQIGIAAGRQKVVGVHDVLRLAVEATAGDMGDVNPVLNQL